MTRAAIEGLNGEGYYYVECIVIPGARPFVSNIVKGNNDTLTGGKLTVANLNTKLFITIRKSLTLIRIRY